MAKWVIKSPEWSKQCLPLLLQVNLDGVKECSIEEIMENSEKHALKFPVDTGRLKTIKNRKNVSREYLQKCINSVYPFLHENVLYLCSKFINLKRSHGSSIEKKFYKDMDLKSFVDRLIKKRAATFIEKYDKYILMTGERGYNNWESIGTDVEKPPLILQNCLSYDEIKLSAFLYISSYTHFVNKGERRNDAVYCEERSKIEDEGIIAGMIGPRLKKDDVMDFQEIVITENQNTAANGYGGGDSVHELFAEFYGERESILFNTLGKRTAENCSRYVDLVTPEGSIKVFDNQIYHKRLSILFDCLLLEANFRAKDAGKSAYIHVVGLGLGVWRISDHQHKRYMESFYERIVSLGEKLTSVSDICFSYIRKESCGGYKNGEIIPIKGHPSKGIRIHIFNRDPHEKLINENEGKLLIVSYAWDGNALPGNEFWDGQLGSSGDSAAASSTQITELHNPHINPLVTVNNLRIVTCEGELIKFQDYIGKIQKIEVPENEESRDSSNEEPKAAENKLSLINEALTTQPRNWSKQHIQVLPKQYLLQNISTFTLTKIWDNLPEDLKNDKEIQSHLPCLEHYNRDEDTIHIDGPPPSKLRCRGCIKERRLGNNK